MQIFTRYIFLILVASHVLNSCQAERDENPNIIIIYADDLGYGDISCQNPESKIKTPNIDKLAQDGIRFTDAHSSAAICTPSRYSLLTGRYCWRTELKEGVLWSWDRPLISKDRLTLPMMLKDKGYQTAAIGKWHLGWIWPTVDDVLAKENNGKNVTYEQPIKGGPIEYGFEYYFGDDVPNFPPYTFIENDRVTKIPTIEKPDSLFGEKGLMVEGWQLDQVMPEITKIALTYIKNAGKKDRPFFLYFPLTAPHDPIAPTKQFIGTSQAGLYGDYVQEIDWAVGQILDILEQNQIERNTLLIFTSDNGSRGGDGTNWLGELGSVMKFGHSPNGRLRGFKGDIWEAGHRVPFIIKWKEKIKSGQVRDDLISQVDILATLSSIVGYILPKNSAEDSYDFSTIILDDKAVDSPRKTLVNHSVDGSFAVRKGYWKLIFTNRSGGMSNGLFPEGFGITTPGQLYNLENDLGEQQNLYEEYPEIVEELTKILDEIKNGGSQR
jgi:arylsulfatase A-like enzyme